MAGPTFCAVCGGEKDAEKASQPCWVTYLLIVCWYLFFPFILVYYSIKKFLVPCILEYIFTIFSVFCFKCSSLMCTFCCSDMRHKDRYFPPAPKSLGGKFEKDKEVKWLRASEIVKAMAVADNATTNALVVGSGHDQTKEADAVEHLFNKGIEPSDIAQGSLGDCWLLSAIAVLAEKSGQIERVFREKTHSIWGRYHIRLYNGKAKKWQTIVIDDFIPCKDGKPIFTKPKGNEMWVLLLEKAFAKLVGSYAELDGGVALYALEALTGDHVAHFGLKSDGAGAGIKGRKWQKMNLVHQADDKIGLRHVEGELYSSDDFFEILEAYEKQGAAMAAGSRGDDDKEHSSGIVKGHAYSILSVRNVGQRQFLKLRNPWGTFSWDGDWSDKSDLWTKHPEVAKALKMTDEERNSKDDGEFWMLMDDFIRFFQGVDILDRDVDIDTIVLEIDEEDGKCVAPLKGCLRGCFQYYCYCEGPALLCCPHRGSADTVKVKSCCGLC